MRIETDDLARAPVQNLIAEHLAEMHATSPAESVHALDLEALLEPSVTVWTLWDDDTVLGCVALKQLSATEGELKSMRTSAAARGRGVAAALLEHVVTQARGRGYRQVSLETGTEDYFAPARRLYLRHGFRTCPPFADYSDDPNSCYFTLTL